MALLLVGCTAGSDDRDPSPWGGAEESGVGTADTDDPTMTSTSSASESPTGSTSAATATTATGSTSGSESTGGLVGCPASAPVSLTQWEADPWTAPASGNAQVEYRLSTETWLHYERFELDLDIDVTEVGQPYNCFLELRNTGANHDETFPWRYFSICTKNENPRKMVHVAYAAENNYLVADFAMQPNTTYHVNVLFDSILDESSLTLTPEGGTPTTIVTTPLTSSITPMGQGLDLWVGFRTSHPDYPTILPPWGWTFRNLEVAMDPGGPYGPLAPGCP